MTKVKLYTLACNRPDFIEVQYNSIKKHVKDDIEYIVFNNEKKGNRTYEPEREKQIYEVCERLGIECIPIEFKEEYRVLNGEIAFYEDAYKNDNCSGAYGHTFAWKEHVSKWDCIGGVIDSDMFFIKDVSLVELMNGYDLGFVPSYRDLYQIKYMWNGFVLANVPNLPNPQELSWGCNKVNGTPVDVGGETYYYLEKYKDQLKLRYWDQVGLLRDQQVPFEICLNGCAQYFADFTDDTLDARDPQASLPPAPKTFPHQKDRQEYWEYFYNMFSRLTEISKQYSFPKPTYFDFLKAEEEDNIDNAFIFHYKAAGNYEPFQNDKYNSEKTEALKKVLLHND